MHALVPYKALVHAWLIYNAIFWASMLHSSDLNTYSLTECSGFMNRFVLVS